jgi:DNA-directed RNA polymerase specialized sigma24 family protein
MGDLERDFIQFRDDGSTRAMARVFDQAAPELLLVAGHLARDAGAAEDLVQGTLLAAIEKRAQFDRSSAPRVATCTVAHLPAHANRRSSSTCWRSCAATTISSSRT